MNRFICCICKFSRQPGHSFNLVFGICSVAKKSGGSGDEEKKSLLIKSAAAAAAVLAIGLAIYKSKVLLTS